MRSLDFLHLFETIEYSDGHFEVFESESEAWYWSYRRGELVSCHEGPYAARALALTGIALQVLADNTGNEGEIDRVVGDIRDELARLAVDGRSDIAKNANARLGQEVSRRRLRREASTLLTGKL